MVVCPDELSPCEKGGRNSLVTEALAGSIKVGALKRVVIPIVYIYLDLFLEGRNS